MILFVSLAVIALASMFWWLWLWRRESSRVDAPAPRSMWALAVLLPLLGSGLYLGFGYDERTGDWLKDHRELRPLVAELAAGRAPAELEADIPQGRIARVLQREMARSPTAEGWYALGLLFGEMEAPEVASQAARRALELEPSVHTRMLLARSLIAKEQGALTSESRRLLEQVLREHPDHDGAWMLLGMGATNAGDHALAARAWENMLERHEGGRAKPVLERSLAFARSQQAMQERFDGKEITVEAGEDLRAGGSLFVYLQREGGSGQPLAARQVLAERFPVTVELRREDWLQRYPDEDEPIEAGARYSPAAGSGVDGAEYRAVPEPLEPGETPRLRLE